MHPTPLKLWNFRSFPEAEMSAPKYVKYCTSSLSGKTGKPYSQL
ncbi:hypothetical protein GCM10020370_12750 [Paenibacillus hodogayensis]